MNGNEEEILFDRPIDNLKDSSYECLMDLQELKKTFDNCREDFLTLNFGNHEVFIIRRGYITNIISECE